MSPEERQLLVELFQRINSVSAQPRDRDAEAFIAEAVRLQPYAPYLLAQTVIVQEQTLRAAGERLQQLEAENRDLQAELQARAQPQPAQGGFLSGLGSLLGGGQQSQPQAPSRPSPQQGGPWGAAAQQSPQQQGGGWGGPPPAGPQGGAWGGQPQQQAGGGFLKGALGAAAGVAGGVLLANSLGSMFGGHGGGGLGAGLGGSGGNNALGAGSQIGMGGSDPATANSGAGGGYHNASGEGDQHNDDAYVSDAGYDSDDSGSDDYDDV